MPLINECKFRVKAKYEKVFLNNLPRFGWEKVREGVFEKRFGTAAKAEIHEKVLPFSGQAYYTVYAVSPETLNKHIIYDIVDEVEKMQNPS